MVFYKYLYCLSIPFGIYLETSGGGLVIIYLSIPFGIYLYEYLQRKKELLLSFNPFWDLSKYNEGIEKLVGGYTFNPFWDLSKMHGLHYHVLVFTFNPFWDLSTTYWLTVNSIFTSFNPFWDLS